MSATEPSERRDALVERLFGATLGAMDVVSVYIGVRLGLYRTLRDRGPSSAPELAEAAGLNERYVREWLEQQATTGILEVDDERRHSLPPGHDEALLDETSLNYIAPVGKFVVACVRPIDAVLAAYRSGNGIPYADYGADLHEGQAEFTRPMFENLLGSEWFPGIPEVHERLQAEPAARVADVACGQGFSTIAIARAYPKAVVDGIDLDEASIAAAQENLSGSGVEDRVSFDHRDAADPGLQGQYDLVYMHESLHDMSYPVEVLRACRDLLAAGGSVVVGDERVPDSFSAPGDDLERLYYGFSIVHCLPVGMVGEGAAGTGTVMRADTVRRYAEEAGFSGFQVLPIENDFYRFTGSLRSTPMLYKVNLAEKLATIDEVFSPRIVGDYNDNKVQVGKIRGEFVWHTHPDTDDFFLVLAGRLTVETRDEAVELGPGELVIVPQGVKHRTRAEEETHILLIEPRGTPNTGDSGVEAAPEIEI